MLPLTVTADFPNTIEVSVNGKGFCRDNCDRLCNCSICWSSQTNIVQKLNFTKSIHLGDEIQSQQVLIVNSKRRNGLILYKKYHVEFAGPGAAIGGDFDQDCYAILPVGDLSLINPQSSQEREGAYKQRRQWLKLVNKITSNPVPTERAVMILDLFENCFDSKILAEIPDHSLASMVGIFTHTLTKVRSER
jgi:hypothetical protein